MQFTTTLLNQFAGPPAARKQVSGAGPADGYAAGVGFAAGGDAMMTAQELRNWRSSNVWIYSAVTRRRQDVAGADWLFQYKDQSKHSRAGDFLIEYLTELLLAPNPDGVNNSWQSLIEPATDDLLCIDNAVIQIQPNAGGTIAGLKGLDGARVRELPGWQGPANGPRYAYTKPDGTVERYYDNDELIVMRMNPTTYSNHGMAPLQILRRILLAEYDTFKSIHILQKNRAPAGFLKMPGASKKIVDTVKALFLKEMAGKSGIGFMDVPAETEFIQLGSVNLAEQGAFAFYDMLIRAIAAAFQITTLNLNWLQDVNRATAQEQSDITDDGMIALLKTIQGYINREVVGRFPNASNVEFRFVELLTKQEAMSKDAIRQMEGRLVNSAAINEMRDAGGLTKIAGLPKDIQDFFDYPLIQVANGQVSTVQRALKLPQYQEAPDPATVVPGQPALNGHGQPAATLPNKQPAALTDTKPAALTDTKKTKGTPQQDMSDGQRKLLAQLDGLFTAQQAKAKDTVAAA